MRITDEILSTLAQQRGWGPQEIDNFRKYAAQVAQVESLGDPTAVQKSKNGPGPGRGKFQFETKAHGGSGASAAAATRFGRFIDKSGIPVEAISEQDRQVLFSEDPDFSQMSEDMQEAVFFSNAAEHPNFKVDDLVTGKMNPEDAWIKYHWAGPEKDEPIRRQHWQDSFARGGPVRMPTNYRAGGRVSLI